MSNLKFQIVKRLAVALCLLLTTGLAHQSRAATSADATIFNKATLTYAGGTVQASVSVSVALVGTTPTLSSPAATAVTSGDVVDILYTLTAGANGKDTYNLSTSSLDDALPSGTLTPPGVVFLAGATGNTTITSLELEAVVTSAPSDAVNQLLIPAGAETNNLSTGTILRLPPVPSTGFAGGTYLVDAITPGTVPDINTTEVFTRVTLIPQGGSPAVGVGDIPEGIQAGEEATFRVRLTGGNLVGGGTSGTHTVSVVADPVTGVAPSATDEVVVTVTPVVVFMTKKVAIYDPGETVANQAFVTSGITASTGDVLIYQIEVGPSSGEPAITAAIVADTAPEFTTYIDDSLTLNDIQVGCASGCPLASDGVTLPLASGTFQVNSKGGPSDDATGTDGVGKLGVIDSNNSATLTFRVTVD